MQETAARKEEAWRGVERALNFRVQVRWHIKPELINRLDEIVIFDPLSHDQLRKVARLQIRLAERGIALGVTDASLDVVFFESYDHIFGVRSIRRWLRDKMVTELSRMLIRKEIDENPTVCVDVLPGKKKLSYRVEKNDGMVNGFTGLKSEILIDDDDKDMIVSV